MKNRLNIYIDKNFMQKLSIEALDIAQSRNSLKADIKEEHIKILEQRIGEEIANRLKIF